MEFTRKEYTFVSRLLAAPSLWAFTILAGELSLEEAVEVCRDSDAMAPEHRELLRQGGCGPNHLPAHLDIVAALQGCRLRAARKDTGVTLQTAARGLGLTREQSHAALRVLEGFGLAHEVVAL